MKWRLLFSTFPLLYFSFVSNKLKEQEKVKNSFFKRYSNHLLDDRTWHPFLTLCLCIRTEYWLVILCKIEKMMAISAKRENNSWDRQLMTNWRRRTQIPSSSSTMIVSSCRQRKIRWRVELNKEQERFEGPLASHSQEGFKFLLLDNSIETRAQRQEQEESSLSMANVIKVLPKSGKL